MLKRTYQEEPICDVSARCDSYIDRMVWDGDQLLWELRQTNTESSLTGDAKKPTGNQFTGTLSYIHAGGIDAPVGMVRNGSAIILHRNWRGLFAFSTDTDGELTTCPPNETPGCAKFPWPARAPWTYWYDPDVYDTHLWYGSLPLDQNDETGLTYRRNRYYDGVTGQFTQEDPIGIAGGLNLYGYADGDPINFSDPFGLSPCDDIKDASERAECFKEKEEQEAEEWLLSQGSDCPTCDMRADIASDLAQESPDAALVIGLVGVGTMTGAGVAAIGAPQTGAVVAAARSLPSSTFRTVFGRGGLLNSNRYLRIGISRHGGDKVFRIGGNLLKLIKSDPHIVLRNLGPL